mgnify:FL=1
MPFLINRFCGGKVQKVAETDPLPAQLQIRHSNQMSRSISVAYKFVPAIIDRSRALIMNCTSDGSSLADGVTR